HRLPGGLHRLAGALHHGLADVLRRVGEGAGGTAQGPVDPLALAHGLVLVRCCWESGVGRARGRWGEGWGGFEAICLPPPRPSTREGRNAPLAGEGERPSPAGGGGSTAEGTRQN